MLLLSLVSINLIQNLGLIEKVKLAKEEHRASTIQEQKELFEKEIEISKYEGSTPKTINDLLDKLEEEKLITEEEKNTIMQTGRITIGSKKIIFDTIILPEGYTRCEYLESTGSQYIDLGFSISYAYIVNCEFEVTNFYNYEWAIGAIYGSCSMDTGRKAYNLLLSKSKEIFYRNASFSEGITSSPIELHKKYRTTTNLNNLTVNNETYTGEFDYNYINSYTSYLFARNTRGRVEFLLFGRIYEFEILDQQGNYILKSIPCLDINDKPCMYDTVSGQTFYNQGTGEFIAGPIVE